MIMYTMTQTCVLYVEKKTGTAVDSCDKKYFSVHLSLIAGWVCYAEKQLGSYILPYISSVKSPQQSMGATIKQHICQTMGFR